MTDDLLAYIRRSPAEALLIALNLGTSPMSLQLPSLGTGRVVLSTYLDRDGASLVSDLALRADEGVIVALA
jgi:hypothetical protein